MSCRNSLVSKTTAAAPEHARLLFLCHREQCYYHRKGSHYSGNDASKISN
jgi:hypothetical protein